MDNKISFLLVQDFMVGTESLDVELRGGPDESVGVVYVNDRPVCADVTPYSFLWTMQAALVTCRMFG